MRPRNVCLAAAASGSVVAFLLAFAAGPAVGQEDDPDRFKPKFTHEFSVGGISRVGKRDPGLIGGGGSFSGTGFAEQQRGKILHAVP